MLEMHKLSLFAALLSFKRTHTQSRKSVEKVQLSARHLDISHCSISPVLRCQHNRLEALKTVVLEEQEKKRVKHKKALSISLSLPPQPRSHLLQRHWMKKHYAYENVL